MPRQTLKSKVYAVLKKHFPTETVDVSAGVGENLHVVVVSKQFEGQPIQEREDWLWTLLKQGLSVREVGRISLLMAVSPEEVKSFA